MRPAPLRSRSQSAPRERRSPEMGGVGGSPGVGGGCPDATPSRVAFKRAVNPSMSRRNLRNLRLGGAAADAGAASRAAHPNPTLTPP